MNKKPLVTVICSCYNHQEYVCQTLDSVTKQTYHNIELIIVDDGSTDESVKTIENWLKNQPTKIQFIKNQKNLGLTKSFNNAIKYASGAYFIDLAADDILTTNCIEYLVKPFLENPSLALVYSNAENINEQNKITSTFFNHVQVSKIKKATENNFYLKLLTKSDVICSVSALHKRSVFNDLNGYDEDLYFEDLDYWLRVTKKYPIAFLDKILVQKRHLENSMGNGFFKKSNHTKKLHTSFYIILKKAFKMNSSKAEYKALMNRIYKQSRWAIKTVNVKYFLLYILLFLRTLTALILSLKKSFSHKK
ncbi:glycosyltransferase family 2 protein [Wenyingzhuangia sp. IMCC45574]